MTSTRLTPTEEEAILVAINASLASPVLDGYDDMPEEEQRIRQAMRSAQQKVWRRQANREINERVRRMR